MTITLSRKQQIIIVSTAGVVLIGFAVLIGYLVAASQRSSSIEMGDYARMRGASMNNEAEPVTAISTADTDRLLYLTEEEKLAHDVYTKLYEKYGVRVFSNIARSETMHQNRMLDLLDARGIDDPRSSEVGVFKNTELQKLYDILIAQGNKSLTEAYKVGVAIEERDIADIEADLKNISAEHTDIVSALDVLLRGSRNHLQAFNRQLG